MPTRRPHLGSPPSGEVTCARVPAAFPRGPSPTVVLALFLAVVAHPVEAQEPVDLLTSPPLVDEVRIQGVRSLDPEALARSLATRPTRCRSLFLQPFCWVTDRGFFHDRRRLDVEELPRDELRIRVYHWLRGFRGAVASSDIEVGDDAVAVTFDVDEGEPVQVRSLEVVQDTPVVTDRGIARARLPPEETPLDLVRLEAGIDTLRQILFAEGFANAEVADSVTIVPAGESASAGGDADVLLRIRAGRRVTVDSVAIRGNEDVEEETIRRALGIERGDLYRGANMDAAQRRLYRSNLFRQSIVTTLEDSPELTDTFTDGAPPPRGPPGAGPDDPEVSQPAPEDPDRADSTRTVIVVVQEAPFDEVGAGVGLTTLQFGQLQGRYARYNFLGGGRMISFQSTVGNLFAPGLHDEPLFRDALPRGVAGDVDSPFLDPTWSTSVEFGQPWFYSSRNSLGVDVFYRRRAVPGVVVDESYGASASLSREFSRGVVGSLRYRFEESRVDAGGIYFCVSFGICESRIVRALQRTHRLSPLSLSFTLERTDDPAAPTRGYSARFDAEHASTFTASDYRYNTASIEGTLYRPLGPGILAVHLRAGWVRSLSSSNRALDLDPGGTSLLHPRKRLYSGGSRSVRGYGENQLGPRIVTVPLSSLTEVATGEDPVDEGSGEMVEPVCSAPSVEAGTCDPNPLASSAFQPRPLGGNQVLELSVEFRRPLFFAGLEGAVFVDAGYVGDLNLNIPSGARGAITPGFGFRHLSPIGVIRADLGIRPQLVERLPVITAVPDGEDLTLVQLETLKRYDPVGSGGGFFDEVFRRLILHLSIGQPY